MGNYESIYGRSPKETSRNTKIILNWILFLNSFSLIFILEKKSFKFNIELISNLFSDINDLTITVFFCVWKS